MAEFKTKARAIDLLGENQISDVPTAVSELFKNAHDADAKRSVLNVDSNNQTLLLWDNGHGMDYADVTERWLTIGTDSKLGDRREPVKLTESKKRVTMGEKGIGRLAIAILGRQLFMITKRKGQPWVLLFIHWGVFQNGTLLLEDTNVPVCELDDLQALEENALRLRDEFRLNLTTSEPKIQQAWDKPHDELKAEILHDLDRLHLHHKDLPLYLQKIEELGHGTVFFVQGLKENWARIASPEGTRGKRSERKREGLESMMGNFSNPFIELYDAPEDPASDDGSAEAEDGETDVDFFKPSIEVDEVPILNKFRFTAKDLETYDYGLEGTIENGVFNGKFLVYGQGSVTTSSESTVTHGIDFAEAKDCGPFTINLYFVEGQSNNSRLDPGLWETINNKLKVIGGLYVYRDGLRVLPYGSQDVDIFHFEKRRTIRAGQWLLSYRRIFGYVSITKRQNPHLKDKSNREGLRENDQYEFFHAVLDNLLTEWNEWIKHTREPVVQEAHEKRRAEEEQALLAARLQKELSSYLKLLRDEFDSATAMAERQKHAILTAIDQIQTYAASCLTPSAVISYVDVVGDLQRLQDQFHRISHQINGLGSHQLTASVKFGANPEVQSIFREYTYVIQSMQHSLRSELVARVTYISSKLRAHLDGYLSTLSAQLSVELVEPFLSSIREQVDQTINSVELARTQAVEQLRQGLNDKTRKYELTLGRLREELSRQHEGILRSNSTLLNSIFSGADGEANELMQLFADFSTLGNRSDVVELLGKIQRRIESTSATIQSSNTQAQEAIRNAVSQYGNALLDGIESSEKGQSLEQAWRLVDFLQQRTKELQWQIDQYRQLVSTGLAAEVANHEFEQQYKLMRRIFARKSVRLLVDQSKELRALEVLYMHLERQHNLLRPLFLQRTAEVKDINLHSVANDMRGIFDNAISTYGITFINRVEESFVIRESEQTLWPVLINIINNAVYWLLDRKERTIVIRSNSERHQLFIEDSGPGISSDKADRVFDLFYSSRPGGRGIGLNIARDLLVAKNHTIRVVTDHDEKELAGASFLITFNAP